MKSNNYSYGIAIHLFAIPLRRGIGISLKKEWNTYSFPVEINKIRLLPKSPNPLNTQIFYPSLCFSTHGVFGYKILKIKYHFDFIFFKNKSYFIQLFINKSFFSF
jgi:hypothetical protein